MIAAALRLAIPLLGLALATPAEAGIRRYGTFPVPDQIAAPTMPPVTRGIVVTPGVEDER
jgi:hypothetical protein